MGATLLILEPGGCLEFGMARCVMNFFSQSIFIDTDYVLDTVLGDWGYVGK